MTTNHIEQVWRQQPRGRQTMSVEEIRTKARDFDMKVQRWKPRGRSHIRTAARQERVGGLG